MQIHRVLVVGSSLYAEALRGVLEKSAAIDLVGSVPDPDAALSILDQVCPDVVILAGTERTESHVLELFLLSLEMSVVCTDLESDNVQIITSRITPGRYSDLIEMIANLPYRSETHD